MAIEYKTVTYRTVESANDNATYCWVELSASHVPAVNGLIKRIVIEGATTSASGMTTDPMYLGIWERQSDGGLIFLGCSKNAVVQAINQQNVWDFDGAIIRGKSLLLGLLSSPTEHWTNNTSLLLRSRVKTNDTDGCVILTDIGRINVTPDITFTVDVPEYIPDEEPEPEPESEEHRIVDISKYWIQIIRNTNEFKQIAIAENPEFNGLLDAIYRALKDGFILEATDYGVSRWEKILGLVVTEGMTLEDRKVQILTYLSVKLPYTKRVLYQMLIEYLGEGNFYFFIDNDTQTFHLSLTADAMSKQADVDQLLKRVLPENLVVDMLVDGVPMDYTLLEYLESSGTQWIDTGIIMQDDIIIRTKAISTASSVSNYLYGVVEHSKKCILSVRQQNKDTFTARIGNITKNYLEYERYFIPTYVGDILNVATYGNASVTLNDVTKMSNKSTPWISNLMKIPIFGVRDSSGGTGSVSTGGNYKLYNFSISQDAEVVRDFVPVLNADGVPGLYDKVSKQFFANKGKGTFGYRLKTNSDIMQLDLDDPYYTAPSGVWAKPIDENTLDIITALDPTVDASQGYKLFANAGEAYKYFNIEEVNEND